MNFASSIEFRGGEIQAGRIDVALRNGGGWKLAMLVVALAFAAGTTAFATPIVINNVTDLQNINLFGDYVLGSDIDASATATWNGGAGFIPIGAIPGCCGAFGFSGSLDGNSHIVSGLTINSLGYAAPIAANVGQIRNIGFTNVSITGQYAGGIAAYNGAIPGQSGTIQNSYVTGTLNGQFAGGGIVALNGGVIQQSHSNASVSGPGNEGGLVGQNNGSISQSYANGSVNGSGPFIAGVGGLVGSNLGDSGGTITQSYATGHVAGSPSELIGGLVGYNSGPTASSSYWDTQSSGQVGSAGGTGLTTAELKSGTLPSGFDPAVWKAAAGQYPTLKSEASAPPPSSRLFAITLGLDDMASTGRVRGDLDAQHVLNALKSNSSWVSDPSLGNLQSSIALNPNSVNGLTSITGALGQMSIHAGDTLVFYYSGHGWPWGRTGDETPVTIPPCSKCSNISGVNTAEDVIQIGSADPNQASTGRITEDQLAAILSDPKLTGVHKIVILDACYSGGFWGRKSPDLSDDLSGLSDTLFLSSASATAKAGIASDGTGFWTDKVLLPLLNTPGMTLAEAEAFQSAKAAELYAKYGGEEFYNKDFFLSDSDPFEFAPFIAASADFQQSALLSNAPEPSTLWTFMSVSIFLLYFARRRVSVSRLSRRRRS